MSRVPGSFGGGDPVQGPEDGEGRIDEVTLRVAVDATPLLGRPTGVGAFCAGALDGLGRAGTSRCPPSP